MKSPQIIKRKPIIKDTKKTMSNCYSITIRTGNGVILGSNTVNEFFTWLKTHTQWFFVSLEKEENEAHFQGGIFYESSKRQDNVRRDILPFVEQMYLDGLGDKLMTEKGLDACRRYALKVETHNNFEVLVAYTLKEGLTPGRTPVISKLPQELKFYVPEQYCEHDEIRAYCSTCYKQEDTELVYIEKGRHWNYKQWDRNFRPRIY